MKRLAYLLVAWTLLATASQVTVAAAATDAPAAIAGEWLAGYGRLTFEHRGGDDYHAIYVDRWERISGRVSFELEGTFDGTVFEGHWISHYIVNNAIEPCRSERNGSPYWGPIRLEFDQNYTRFAGFHGRCERSRRTKNWLGRRALTGDEASLDGYSDDARDALEASPAEAKGRCTGSDRFTLVIHGGAFSWDGMYDEHAGFIKRVLALGEARLAAGATALDTVEWAIRAMEDSGLFSAGKGSGPNKAGVVELDASIMAGRNRQAGAVAAVTRVKNPISAARLVMDRTPHVLMVGPGADDFTAAEGGEMVDQDYFVSVGNDFSSIVLPGDIEVEAPDPAVPTDIAAFSGIWVGRWFGTRDTVVVVVSLGPEAAEVLYAVGAVPDWGIAFPSWRRLPAFHSDGTLTFGVPGNLDHRFSARMSDSGELSLTYDNKLGRHSETSLTRWTEEAPPGQHGTVGAVALDRCRDLAAGTSTAGWGSKPPGRVSDSPIIGAGTYADNETAAISATGHGEYFIRFAVAHDITAMMRYTGASLEEAANKIIKVELFRNGGKGGVIAVDREGNVAMPFNTRNMLRGAVGSDRPLTVEID